MTWLCPGTNATAPTDMGNSPLAAETGSHERPSSTDCHKPPDPDPTRIWSGYFGSTAMQPCRPETANCAAPYVCPWGIENGPIGDHLGCGAFGSSAAICWFFCCMAAKYADMARQRECPSTRAPYGTRANERRPCRPEFATFSRLVYACSKSPLLRLSSVRRHNTKAQTAITHNKPSSVRPFPPSG